MSALLGNVSPKGIMYLVYSTELIDAQLLIHSAPGAGTTIELQLPL